jgi:uncharacterized membrane protein
MSSYFEDPYNFIKRTFATGDMIGEYLKHAESRRIENHIQELISDVAKMTTRVAEVESSMQARTASKAVETLQQGISLKIENEGGEVYNFPSFAPSNSTKSITDTTLHLVSFVHAAPSSADPTP